MYLRNPFYPTFHFLQKNALYEVALDRFSSIIHNNNNNGFYSESVKHFFLKCPLFATSRHKLFSSAAQIFAERWACMYDTAIVSAFLSGCPSLSYDENRLYFCLSRRLS